MSILNRTLVKRGKEAKAQIWGKGTKAILGFPNFSWLYSGSGLTCFQDDIECWKSRPMRLISEFLTPTGFNNKSTLGRRTEQHTNPEGVAQPQIDRKISVR